MRKLAIFAFSFTAVIASCLYADGQLWPVIAIAVICAALFALSKGENRTRIILAAAGAAAGFLWISAYGLIFYQPAVDMAGDTLDIVCEVTDYPDINDYGVYVRVRIRCDKGPDITAQLRLENQYSDLAPGDTVEVYASLTPADKVWGEETDYYRSGGVFLKAYQDGDPEISRSESVSLRYIPARISRALREKISEIFPQDAVGFITAILTGDKSPLDDDDYSALQTSGAAHVVAVSGMHISFLVGLLLNVTGKKKRTSLICIPIIILFMAMVGFTPSVVRAGVMQTFVLLAPIFGREDDTLTSLSTALLVLLAINPYSICSTSLQLSFASVLGINLISGKISSGLIKSIAVNNKIVRKILVFIIESLSTSIGAIVFTIPIMAVTFDYISVYSPITNILILWAVSFVFSGAVIVCLLGFLLPFAGIIFAWPVTLLVRYILLACHGVSMLPGAVLYTLSDYIRMWLVFFYMILWVFFILSRGKKAPYVPAGLGIILFCMCFLLTGIDAYMADMEVTALDVGQGQGVVITMSSHTVVVDCGSESRNTAGERTAKYLFSKNIFYLDVLVLTHFDADHVNGATELMDRVEIGTLVMPEPADSENSYVIEILETAEAEGIDICYVTSDMIFNMGGSTLTVYAPVGRSSSNESGLAIVGTCSDFDVLITGDMDSAMERRLVKLKNLPDIEVLLVGHHGSKYSSSEELLKVVRAEVAIISVGGSNYYGHPTEEAISRLEEYGSQIFRTDQAGNITVKAR